MYFYLAPMEGITGFVYRNAFAKYFGGVEKYFTPFLTPSQKVYLNKKEKKDVMPEVNSGIIVVPQIMTNKAEHFTGLQKELIKLGYNEINLNLGCPAPTVVTKGKGAGFLADTEKLDEFLYDIFEKDLCDISIKTRLGVSEPEEIFPLMDIYNKYSMTELIVHPRVREDFYKNSVNLDVFEQVMKMSKNKIVYNGDIHSLEDYICFADRFKDVDKMMLGRGLLYHPDLILSIEHYENNNFDHNGYKCDVEKIIKFMDEVMIGYYNYMKSEKNVLFRMKELWLYFHKSISDGEKYWKKICKAKDFKDYYKIISMIQENICETVN